MAEVNVRKRGTKWQYYFEIARESDKRKRVYKSGFKTKKEALEAGTLALATYHNCGETPIESEISVTDFANNYILHCERNLKYSTYSSYRGVLNAHLIKEYGIYQMKDVNMVAAEKLIYSMKEQGLSHSTIRKNINVINQMFRYAVQQKIITLNPFSDMKVPGDLASLGNPNTAYTDEQINQFLKTFKNDILEVVLMIGYHCGLRLSEIIALTWDDINFQNKSLTVNKQLVLKDSVYYFSTPKYGSSRTVFLDNSILEYLFSLKAEAEKYDNTKRYKVGINNSIIPGNEFMFVCARPGGLIASNKYIHQRLDSYKNRGCKVFRPHDLRHTHCTKLLSNGMDIKYVQKRLGHKNVHTTLNIYHHLTENVQISESEKLNDLF